MPTDTLPCPAPERLDLGAPLHVDPAGARYWRTASGCLEPVRHRLCVPDPLCPLWRFLAARADQRHIRLTGGAWELTDKGMARLAHFGAGRDDRPLAHDRRAA